ncbi:hypothetical protein Q1695_009052 [Nippostrongylus brasiliensis]|nr:hypothetical protein Q1695_009052 [Nippostrongylus brasiliensis]
MRPRRQSIDSETSSDSWSVIQKNVDHVEAPSEDIVFDPSDSEQWDSDGEQGQPEDFDSDEDAVSDSLEEYDDSQETDDEQGDCEIVDEKEAMDVSGSRYYVSSEKVHQSLDMLGAKSCSTVGELLNHVWPSSRDTTRAVVLVIFVVTTATLLGNNARLTDVDSLVRSDEVFASGLQSRKNFGRTYTPLFRRRHFFNFSKTCQQWQTSSWSSTPGWSAPVRPTSRFVSLNTTPLMEINELPPPVMRPVMKAARISISRPPKVHHNVCRQQNVRHRSAPMAPMLSVGTRRVMVSEFSAIQFFAVGQHRLKTSWKVRTIQRAVADATRAHRLPKPLPNTYNESINGLLSSGLGLSRSLVLNISITRCQRYGPVGPPRPLPHLSAAPISISKVPKTISDVCVQPVKRRAHWNSSMTISTKKFMKQLGSGPRRRLISYKRPTAPAIRTEKSSALARSPPKHLAIHRKNRATRPCVPISSPCTERNSTIRRYSGFTYSLAKVPVRQLATYRSRPLPPSRQRLVHPRPCMDRRDEVKCWKSLQGRQQPKKPSKFDWFTRRGQIRAENRGR